MQKGVSYMKRGKWHSKAIAFLAAVVMIVSTLIPAAPVSASTGSYHNPYTGSSKKGIQVDLSMLSDVEDLGVSEAFFNIVAGDFLSNTPTKHSYTCNGETFYFNETQVEHYDIFIKRMSEVGINVTLAIVNPYRPGFEYLLYTGAEAGGVQYYAFNTKGKGRNAVEALCHFVAGRYNGGTYGTVSNYVVGNEVNDNKAYNYVGEMGIDEYVPIYYEAFKMMYDAVRAEKPDANLYIPLEQRWTTENTAWDYAGRDFLQKFDELSKRDGNIYWNVAYHPYSFPLTNPNVMKDGWPSLEKDGKFNEGGEVTDDPETKIITMKNIHVLTDFMQSAAMRNKDGEVRSVILSEQGYTSNPPDMRETNGSWSAQGGINAEIYQAASIAYAYYVAEMNPYIDSFILNGQVDIFAESEFYKFGLWNSNGSNQPTTKKLAYDVYKYIDTDISLQVTEFAPSWLGIESWEKAVPNFDASRFTRMKSVTEGTVFTYDGDLASAGPMIAEEMGVTQQPGSDGATSSIWTKGYYTNGFSLWDHSGAYYPKGLIVLDGAAYHHAYQSAEYSPDTPIDMSDTPYLGLSVKLIPSDPAKEENMIVRIRINSGVNVYDASCSVKTGVYNKLFVDLSEWEYKGAVDRISVWVKEKDTDTSFNGTMAVYDLVRAKNMTGLPASQGVLIGPSTLAAQGEFAFSTVYGQTYGQGFRPLFTDYSAVYNPEYYYANNPDVAAKYGNSPALLLEHFVRYGMNDQRRASGNFDVKAYKEFNTDLAVFGENYPLYYKHYVTNGYNENRKAVYDGESGKPDNPDTPDTPDTYETVYNGVDYSSVYDFEYYVEHYGDIKSLFKDNDKAALEHFVNCGMSEGRVASAEFDIAVYKANNEDLRRAFGENQKAYYIHYIEHGRYEKESDPRRNAAVGTPIVTPPAATHETVYNGVDYGAVYDFEYYIAHYGDMMSLFKDNDAAALEHFVNYGMAEHRQGSEAFNPVIYKGNYKDLRDAFGDDWTKYYRHYMSDGKNEGRNAVTEIAQENPGEDDGIADIPNEYSDVFSASYYYNNNADVAGAFGKDAAKLLEHFVNCGMQEGRQGSGAFNPQVYKSNYKDLRDAFGDDWKKYYEHYIADGKREGRNAVTQISQENPGEAAGTYSDVFDASYYRDNNQDVAGSEYGASDEKLLEHFVNYGMKEGRQACENFSPRVYRANNGDLEAAFGDDWTKYYQHYMEYGKHESHRVTK